MAQPTANDASSSNPLNAMDTSTQDVEDSTDVNGDDSLPNGTAEAQENQDVTMQDQPAENGLPESRVPPKKDATLREFLSKMDDHAPIIPDAVTNYYMTLAGLPPPPQTPLPLARLLALATQKFIADVAADAFQYSRIRNSSASSSALAGMPGIGPQGVPGMPGEKGEKAGDKGKNQNLGVHRAGFGGGHAGGQNKTVLTLEDLGMAVGEYGIGLRRGEFYR